MTFQEQVLASMKPEARAKLAAGVVAMEKLRADRLKQRDFEGYLQTFGHQERFQQLIKILPLPSDVRYWPLVRSVWMSVETIEQDKMAWLKILESKRPSRELLMSDAERAGLAAMPDEIHIWRGCGHKAGVRGMSWTTEKSRAEFFAGYAGHARRKLYAGVGATTPIVASATCRKSDVFAFFTEREESEIVLNPAILHGVKIEAPPAR